MVGFSHFKACQKCLWCDEQIRHDFLEELLETSENLFNRSWLVADRSGQCETNSEVIRGLTHLRPNGYKASEWFSHDGENIGQNKLTNESLSRSIHFEEFPMPLNIPFQGLHVIKLPEVIEKTKLGRSTIYRLINSSSFPAPVKLVEGGHASGWLLSDIERYIAGRFNQKASI